MRYVIAGIVVAAVVGGAVAAFLVARSGDEEEDSLAARPVPAARAATRILAEGVVVPVRSAELSFPSSGIVGQLLVSEGDQVEIGQLLVRLSDEARDATVAQAEAKLATAQARLGLLTDTQAQALADEEQARPLELANARIAVRDAQEMLDHMSGSNRSAGGPITPTGAVLEATRTLALANARRALQDATDALEDATDTSEILEDTQADVNLARVALDTARQNQMAVALKTDERLKLAKQHLDDTRESYGHVYEKWLGIELTEEEAGESPEALAASWGLDLDSAFDGRNLTTSRGVPVDNPSTRWNEPTVFAQLYLIPGFDQVRTTCDEQQLLPEGVVCIEREMQDGFEALDLARNGVQLLQIERVTAVASAEETVLRAEQDLSDAEDALVEFLAEPHSLKVDVAQAELSNAQASLEALMAWADPLELARVETRLESATSDVSELEAGRSPLDVTQSEAAVAVARAEVALAEAGVALARASGQTRELRASFSGTVVSVNADVGEHVPAGAIVVRLADMSAWRIETRDLDEPTVASFREGDRVVVTFDALGDLELAGSVARVGQLGERRQGLVIYTAEIDLDDRNDQLRWNMTAAIRKAGQQ